jgi:hypothetical protein
MASSVRLQRVFALIISTGLAGCGLYTPSKDPFKSDTPTREVPIPEQAAYELRIVEHVECEIALGLYQAKRLNLPWLMDWGVTVTQSITAEDQSGLAPGLTFVQPMQNAIFTFPTGGNVVSPQSFSVSVGATASANALRTEMIQYTFSNRDLLRLIGPDCLSHQPSGVLIDGDLKIREFIYDKAVIAASNNAILSGSASQRPSFNTWTEEITFVAAYGGTATPTWKLARLTANASSNLVVAERTNTNDLIITLGPLGAGQPKKDSPLELTQSAMTQHNARVSAAAIAVSISGQSH